MLQKNRGCAWNQLFPAAVYNLTTLCLSGTLSCVDSMDVIMGDIPLLPHINTAYILYLA